MTSNQDVFAYIKLGSVDSMSEATFYKKMNTRKIVEKQIRIPG